MQRERNTRYFHASVVTRRCWNQIVQLKDNKGKWCTDEAQLKQMAYEFYKTLYSKGENRCRRLEKWQFPKLLRASLRWLNREISDQEIKIVVFYLGPHKAPGPDGLLASFFQKYWAWVGEDVIHFVKGIFHTGVVPEEMNQSMICLIPKQDTPKGIL